MPNRLTATTLLVAFAILALPAVASAKTVPMRGVVSGSPYGASGGQMAVPVLFSKMTARNTGLKSPVGVIIMKRTQKVKLPSGGGTTIPVQLRTGDRFKGFGEVGSLQQRVFYPRVVFSKPSVYFRSKELSLAELSAAIDALRKAIADLQNQMNILSGLTAKAVQDLYGQIDALRKQLAAIQALSVPNFQAQIDALNKRLDDLIAGLPDFGEFLTLGDLAGYAKLTDLTGLLTAPDVTTIVNGIVDPLVSDLQDQVDTLTANLDTVCSALDDASVTLDPDGGLGLPPVTVPVDLGTAVTGVCGP